MPTRIQGGFIADNSVDDTEIAANSVTSGDLQSSATDNTKRAVGTDHIQDNAVTSIKLRSDASVDANRAVGTNHIKDGAVTKTKVADGTYSISISGNADTATNASKLNNQEPSYYLNYNNLSNLPTIPTNTNQLTNGAGYITSSASISGNAATATTAGNGTKAWINFNGDAPVATRANYNISSVVRTGAGQYTLTFSTALSNENYVVVAVATEKLQSVAELDRYAKLSATQTTTQFSLVTGQSTFSQRDLLDITDIYAVVYGS